MNIDLTSFFESEDKSFKIKDTLNSNDSKYDITNLNIIFPITFEGTFHDLNGEFLLDLNVNYEYNTECSRCLKKVINKVSSNVEVILIKDIEIEEAEDSSLIEYIDISNNELDISDLVFSQVITSIPLKVLCNENCKGLCPQCGKDLNEGPCNCEREDLIDPRFQKLQGLFNEEV